MNRKWMFAFLVLMTSPITFAQGVIDNYIQGFGQKYQVNAGDVDGDGDIDIYVKERPGLIPIDVDGITIPIERSPHVVPFVLRQEPNKTFSLVTNLAGLNLTAAGPSSIRIRSVDVNRDERTDSILTGLGAVISGASDQIVFANPAAGVRRNTPAFVRGMDSGLRSFVEQVSGWFQNTDYFEITAIANGWSKIVVANEEYVTAWWNTDYIFYYGYTIGGTPLVATSDNIYDPNVPPARCVAGGLSCRFSMDRHQWQMYVRLQELRTEVDYSRFNADALAFANALAPTVGNDNPNDDLIAGSSSAQSVDAILTRVLGQAVFGGVLRSQGRLPDEENIPNEWLGHDRLESIEGLLADLNEATAPTQPPAPFVAVNPVTGVTVVQTRVPELDQGSLGTIKAIVLHRTSGSTLEGALVSGRNTREGTHFYIDKDGTVHQTVSLDRKTAHVGRNIKSKCRDQPTTCTAAQRQKDLSIRGIGNLSRSEKAKTYPNRYPVNGDSVGIEVVAKYDKATNTFEAPTPEQQQAIDGLITTLKSQYGITDADIYHHDDISYKIPGEGKGLGH